MMSVQEISNLRVGDNFGQDAFNDATDLQNDEFIVRIVVYSIYLYTNICNQYVY